MSRENTNQPEYRTELKLAAVRRVLAGESVRVVAQELGIPRKRLYVWKDRYAEWGEAGLVGRLGGRPRKVVSEDKNGPNAMSGRGELLAARKRIAELERKVGQQELELDFFGEALRRIKAGGKCGDRRDVHQFLKLTDDLPLKLTRTRWGLLRVDSAPFSPHGPIPLVLSGTS